jgi:hypothetical protein
MSKRFISSVLSNPLAQEKWALIFAPLLSPQLLTYMLKH